MWFFLGVLRSYNENVDVLIIPEGAHHIDLRADHKLDPASVKEARMFHTKKIKKWINDFWKLKWLRRITQNWMNFFPLYVFFIILKCSSNHKAGIA